MDYYTETNYIDHDQLRTAGGKGRDDYFEVLRRMGLSRILIPTLRRSANVTLSERIRLERELRRAWREALKDVGRGDTIILHSPPSEKFLGYAGVIKELRDRGCRIINIVFDLESYFMTDYSRAAAIKRYLDRRSESMLFRNCDVIIVHNEKMKDILTAAGLEGDRIVCVGVMDYLRDDGPIKTDKRFTPDGPVIYCGGLDRVKSGFLYELSDIAGDNEGGHTVFDLYGPGYTGLTGESVRYKGVYPALELMDVIEGSFGLVWDGSSTETCTGACGEYLRFNNPHKLALYLASGMPVIVWDESAMADFVLRENCGIAVSSLRELPQLISALTDQEYEELKKNACRMGGEMRKGSHIHKAIETALEKVSKII